MNFATVLAPKTFTSFASTYFVRCSIAIIIYLVPPILLGRGPIRSIKTVWKVKFGLINSYVIVGLNDLFPWHIIHLLIKLITSKVILS